MVKIITEIILLFHWNRKQNSNKKLERLEELIQYMPLDNWLRVESTQLQEYYYVLNNRLF